MKGGHGPLVNPALAQPGNTERLAGALVFDLERKIGTGTGSQGCKGFGQRQGRHGNGGATSHNKRTSGKEAPACLYLPSWHPLMRPVFYPCLLPCWDRACNRSSCIVTVTTQ